MMEIGIKMLLIIQVFTIAGFLKMKFIEFCPKSMVIYHKLKSTILMTWHINLSKT